MSRDRGETGTLAAAIHAVSLRVCGDVRRMASPHYWARRHPWIAVTMGLVSGILLGEAGWRKIRGQVALVLSRKRSGEMFSRLAWSGFALVRMGALTAARSVAAELRGLAYQRDNWFPPD